MQSHDAIIVGAGHNGLVAAAYLARAGLNVLVLEQSDRVGGAAVSRSLYPGFTYSNCSYVCSLFRPEIYRTLELAKHGLQIIPYDGSATLTRDGNYIATYRDADANRRELARWSIRDAEAYTQFSRAMSRHCRFIKPWLLRTPFDPTSIKPRDLKGLWQLYQDFNKLDEEQVYEILRFYAISCANWLDEFFESDVVKGHLAGSSIIGTGLGPYSPGSAYVMLHHYMGEVDGNMGAWGFARGGMGAVSNALRDAFLAAGGEVKTDAMVARVITREGKVTGVALANGDEFASEIVLSGLDVKRTFLQLVEPADLPEKFLTEVKNFRTRGSSGKLNIALDGLPDFPMLPKDSPARKGDLHIVDSMQRLERGYDEWKEGRWSSDPYVDMVIPSQIDPTMAPAGKHIMSVFVQYVPEKLGTRTPARDWTNADRDAFGNTVINAIAAHSPDFKNRILHTEVRTPRDLEDEVGLTGGNIFQGELTLDQLFFNRPLPGYAQYRSSIPGLYLCGSSTHPGGGVMGAPGANAAREVLIDLRITS